MKKDLTTPCRRLDSLLLEMVERFPHRIALVQPDEDECSYEELYRISQTLAEILQQSGLQAGDRVGICMQKSVGSVAAIFAVLMSGGTYVPVDPGAPVSRVSSILESCGVHGVIIDQLLVNPLIEALDDRGHNGALVWHSAKCFELIRTTQHEEETRGALNDPIAYILHTSGSTGEPKGVALTHRNALSFVDWCTGVVQPSERDRFASHAPFHFDLSILDLFLAAKHGAGIVLLNSNDPRQLARDIAEEGVTIWYATPSVLHAVTSFGRMERYDFTTLRMIVFAGEVFPLDHLRALKEKIPHARYLHLYGPTETNVCTYYEIPDQIPPEQEKPFPIGKPCSHMECKVVNGEGVVVDPGQTGELLVHGEGVMVGYWNRPEETERVFLEDESGNRWYRTGDSVFEDQTGNLHYLGRNDRMIKRRGYRIELGEIEHCLSKYEPVDRAAVIAVPDETGVQIIAFCAMKQGGTLSTLRIREFVAEHLPLSMMPDRFVLLPEIPKTSTLKTDYKRLEELS